MAVKSLQTTVDRWAAGTQAGQQAYVDGVQNTDVDVIGRAIAALPQAAQNYAAAVNSGLMARRLAAVGTSGWKQATGQAAAAAWAAGVAAKKGKYQAKMQAVLAYESNLQGQIASMPSGTPAANDARMLAWANGMRQGKAQGAFG